nr:unnamed protein product [Spirometra erinaceieuropaei]
MNTPAATSIDDQRQSPSKDITQDETKPSGSPSITGIIAAELKRSPLPCASYLSRRWKTYNHSNSRASQCLPATAFCDSSTASCRPPVLPCLCCKVFFYRQNISRSGNQATNGLVSICTVPGLGCTTT